MSKRRPSMQFIVGCMMSLGFVLVWSRGEAQSRMQPGVHIGLVAQETRLTSEMGWVLGASLPIALSHWVIFDPSVDLVGTHVIGTLLACAFVAPTNQCLARPDGETVAYLNAVVRADPLAAVSVRPFLEAGGALGQSFNTSAVGARARFLAPQLGGGVVWQTPIGAWSVAARWRSLDRWSPTIDAGAHIMLFVGYRPNRAPAN